MRSYESGNINLLLAISVSEYERLSMNTPDSRKASQLFSRIFCNVEERKKEIYEMNEDREAIQNFCTYLKLGVGSSSIWISMICVYVLLGFNSEWPDSSVK